MKSTTHPVVLAPDRLICTRCGLVAQPGTLGWRALTAVSHAGPTVADELAGHEVALDLCRWCLRGVLKAALGIESRSGAPAGVAALAGLADEARAAMLSMCATDAYIRASNARLEAWRLSEGSEDTQGVDCP